jgi:hypothetical protein
MRGISSREHLEMYGRGLDYTAPTDGPGSRASVSVRGGFGELCLGWYLVV